MPFAPPSSWQPAALSQAPVPYPLLPFQRPLLPAPRAAAPAQSHSWTMPWSQLPGTMGFPGDQAEYNRKFQQSYSSLPAALAYGNKAAQAMFMERDKWNLLPNKVKAARRNTGGGTYLNPAGGSGRIDNNSFGSPFQQAMDQANQANEARYRDILSGLQSRYQRNLSMMGGLGQQEARDINEAADQSYARGQQDLIGRGLGNSTRLVNLRMGVDRERNADLGRLNERMRSQVMNADSGLSGDVLSFMERKNENAPDMRLLAQLAQGVGAAGFGLPSGYAGAGRGGPTLGTAWATMGGFPAGMIDGGGMANFGNPMASMPSSMFRSGFSPIGMNPAYGGMPQMFGLPSNANPANYAAMRDARSKQPTAAAPSSVPNWGPYYQALASQRALQAQGQRAVDQYRSYSNPADVYGGPAYYPYGG